MALSAAVTLASTSASARVVRAPARDEEGGEVGEEVLAHGALGCLGEVPRGAIMVRVVLRHVG